MRSFKLTIVLLVILGLEILATFWYQPFSRIIRKVFTPNRTVMIGTTLVHLDGSFVIEREITSRTNDELHILAATYRDVHVIISGVAPGGHLDFDDYLYKVFLKHYIDDIDNSKRFDFEYANDTAYCYQTTRNSSSFKLDISHWQSNFTDSVVIYEENVFIPDKHIYYCIAGENISENDAIEIVRQTLYHDIKSSFIMID